MTRGVNCPKALTEFSVVTTFSPGRHGEPVSGPGFPPPAVQDALLQADGIIRHVWHVTIGHFVSIPNSGNRNQYSNCNG